MASHPKAKGQSPSGKEIKRLTNAQFFQLCEELRNYREKLTTDKPTYINAIAQLEERLKFGVPIGALKDAMQLTGVDWTPKKEPPKYLSDPKYTVKNGGRILTKRLIELYEKFGEPVPEDLKFLWKGYNSSHYQPKETGPSDTHSDNSANQNESQEK